MSQSVDVAFIRAFNKDVHLAYQRHGSKLRGTIRTQTGVRGETLTFQKMGRGAATQKSRHGNIPPMNVAHSNVTVTIEDYYGLDYVDDLDKLKINIEEQKALQKTIVSALARQTDDQIVIAAEATPNIIPAGGAGMDRAKMDTVMVNFGELDVPDDGMRYCFVGWRQWADMMNINEFVNADFIGPDHPLKQWPNAQFFNGIWWAPFSGLNLNGTERNCIAYHWSAIGHAIQHEIETEIAWVTEKDAWAVKGKMAMGAIPIDTDGMQLVQCQE